MAELRANKGIVQDTTVGNLETVARSYSKKAREETQQMFGDSHLREAKA